MSGEAFSRYNLSPTPGRVGVIQGYLIYANDPNPSYIPFNVGPSQDLFDFSYPNGYYALSSPNTLVIQKSGYYNVSFSVYVVSNSQGVCIVELLTNNQAIGTTPPVIASGDTLNSVTVAPNYSFATTLNCSANAYLKAGTNLVLAYTTTVDAEISLTSNLSLTLLREI